MQLLSLGPSDARIALGAMRTLAECDGEVSPQEASLLEAMTQALQLDQRWQELPALKPEEVASAVPERTVREVMLQAMLLLALMDGTADPREVQLLERWSAVLDVDEPRVRGMRLLAGGHHRLLWFDLARKAFAVETFRTALEREGPRGVWNIVGPMIGLANDPELARKYVELGALPQGTLGRAYFEFITKYDLGFPGEGPVPEAGVWHDLTHVLAGYDTSPEGEVQVVSFIAGYRREDPFFWLFTIALQFHLGLKMSPYSPDGITGKFDPPKVLHAVRRGMQLTKDLSEHWDFWPELPLSLEEVRRKYNVPPP